jgi:Leucine-rich repeat (LRR) protein
MRGRLHGLLAALVLCYFTISSIAAKASSCVPEERDALLSFKVGVTDPGDKLRSWQGQDCCNCSGVACSKKTLHVIRLDVSQYSLKGEGEINSSLAALTRLAYLDLSDNYFGGLVIPEFVGSFKKLRYLDLSCAYFGGKVPPQLGNLSTLEHVDLNSLNSPYEFQLDSLLWVSRLTSLTYLDLGWVSLAASPDWVQALSKLPLLEVLHFNDAFLPATDFDSVSHVNFTALTVLDLKSNEMNSSLLNWIWRLHSLSYLDLSSCQLSGSVPAKIGNLTSLKYLLLRDNHLTGEIPQAMHRLCSLNHIDLSMNNLVRDIVVVEKNIFHCMKQLRTLDVHSNNLTGSLSGWFEDLTSVTYLDISKNFFSRQVPENLSKLSNLTHLDLSSNALEGALSEIHFDKLSRLDFLNLGSNNLKVAIEPKWMPRFQLKGLGLHACRLGPTSLPGCEHKPKFEMVCLGSPEIMSTLPDWLWNFSSSITILDLSNNSITGPLPSSLEQMKMLRMFNVSANLLVGRIPDLPASVEILDLSLNLLSGSLPQSLRAVKLYSMILSYNNLSGIIPSYLCSMLVMEVISLSNNYISGVLPDCWQNVSRLQTIDFSNNKLYGEIPSTMGSITSLAILILRENRLSGKLPASLQSCNGLIILDLGDNYLSGGMPTWNSQQSLFMLSLRSNQFSGEIPEQLSQLRSLEILDLSGNNLSGPVPGSLGNLTAMQLNSGRVSGIRWQISSD